MAVDFVFHFTTYFGSASLEGLNVIFWTISATEAQKAVEDNQNKENRDESREFVVLQTKLAFFPGSRSKQVILKCHSRKERS